MGRYYLTLLIIVVVLLALAGLAFMLLPRFLFEMLFKKPKRSTKIPDFYKDSPHYKVSRAAMAQMEHMVSEDHFITSRDGLKLHGYLFPVRGDRKKFVIGVHGYRSYARPECAPYVEFYQKLGFSMLMVDDRAHAPSEGEYIGFGVLDRLDVVDWCKYLVKTYGREIQILLHGVSMGGATVLAASGEEDLPAQVIGITADCGFTSARDILKFQLLQSMKLKPEWVMPGIEKLCKEKIGFDFDNYSAIRQVKKAKAPILFVQGMKDTMVPPFMVNQLFEACSSKKRILKVEEAGHAESICFMKEEYEKAIIEHFHLEVKTPY